MVFEGHPHAQLPRAVIKTNPVIPLVGVWMWAEYDEVLPCQRVTYSHAVPQGLAVRPWQKRAVTPVMAGWGMKSRAYCYKANAQWLVKLITSGINSHCFAMSLNSHFRKWILKISEWLCCKLHTVTNRCWPKSSCSHCFLTSLSLTCYYQVHCSVLAHIGFIQLLWDPRSSRTRCNHFLPCWARLVM